MAIFKEEENSSQDIKTVIGPSVKVEGNFLGEGNISVEGVVNGSLKTNNDLSIGSSAKIKAEVEAKNLFLSGEIRGNVKIYEKAKLSGTAKIFGNLETKSLVVEEGAIINGKCSMIKTPEEVEPKKPQKNS